MPPGNDALAQFFALTAQRVAIPAVTQDLGLLRMVMEDIIQCTSEPTEVLYEEVTSAGGRPALWHIPLSARDSKNVILYFHGGGFVTSSLSSHRKMVGHLAKWAGCKALGVDYRLAPEARFPSQIEDGVEAYKWLLKQGYKPENIATAVRNSAIP
jgi:monoterpene epsilon-lactone hydrolase